MKKVSYHIRKEWIIERPGGWVYARRISSSIGRGKIIQWFHYDSFTRSNPYELVTDKRAKDLERTFQIIIT